MSNPSDVTTRICLSQGQDSSAQGTFEVRGLGDELLAQLRFQPPTAMEWPLLFAVFVVTDPERPTAASLPMWGSYRIEQDLVRFLPLYPLCEGHRYFARCCLGAHVEASFALPQKDRPPPQVLRVYPSAEALPENLLRFYVYFSQPMRQGQAQTAVRLYELATDSAPSAAAEQEVEGVFLDPVAELWDPEQTRLTLILDPGRVKTGLAAHAKLGRALTPGRRYRLEVGCGFRNAWGSPLRSAFSKSFAITNSWTEPPLLSRFQLVPPPARTHAPLQLRLPMPMDHVLLAAFLRVHDQHLHPVAGEVSLHEDESLWHFVPRSPWEPGPYVLEVNQRLEDLAGNTLQAAFDRPAAQPLAHNGRIALPFLI